MLERWITYRICFCSVLQIKRCCAKALPFPHSEAACDKTAHDLGGCKQILLSEGGASWVQRVLRSARDKTAFESPLADPDSWSDKATRDDVTCCIPRESRVQRYGARTRSDDPTAKTHPYGKTSTNGYINSGISEQRSCSHG